MDEKPLLSPNPVEIPGLAESLPKKKTTQYKIKELQHEALLEIESRPGQYTPEKLRHWKGIGLTKPDFVTEKDWQTVDKDLSPVQGIICHLAALGMSHEQISAVTGTSIGYISTVVSGINGKEEIQRVQDKVWGDDFKKIIQKIVPLAIQTAVQAMLNPNTKAQTRVDAAFKFMDRAMGKPVQQIEVSDGMLRAVFEKLDAENVISIQRTTESPLTLDQPPATVKSEEKREEPQDPVDAWVKENL